MPFLNPKSLSLLLFLVHYTLASDESNPLISPQSQDPSSSSAINFPHDDAGNINDLIASTGWTTAAAGDLGNTGDNMIEQQQDLFRPADDVNTQVACADSAPSSQDGNPSTPPGKKRRRSHRLVRKRDDPPGFCRSEDYAPSSSSSDGGTTTTLKRRPGRPPGKTNPADRPIKIPKAMPLLGDPNSPLCNQYFPGLGSNYAVCYYPYFKTISHSPLVHMVSPCRACKFFYFLLLLFFFPYKLLSPPSPPPQKKKKKKAFLREILHPQPHLAPSLSPQTLSIIRYEIDFFVRFACFYTYRFLWRPLYVFRRTLVLRNYMASTPGFFPATSSPSKL